METINEIGVKYTPAYQIPESKITCSEDVFNILKVIHKDNEEFNFYETFGMLILSKNNNILSHRIISKGGVSGTSADPKIIFSIALKAVASSIIVYHNHPSGNKNPSETDIRMTKKLKEGGKILEIDVLDHVIIAGDFEDYFSFGDESRL